MLTLYLEINNTNYIFFVGNSDEQNNFKIVYKLEVPLKGIEDNRISDLENVYLTLKENIYLIEQNFNHTFKEVIIILDNFNPTFLNVSGYKKLNGTQILRENITYILNNLKSYINLIETKKNILHIFNSNFYLDNKKIDNLPIGLFGDFYSHELSFVLINSNDYKNLIQIFDKCSLKVEKILIKSFVKGAYINEINNNSETFFQIRIGKNNSKIFYFENNSLKFEQFFKFGTSIIVKDISKIISLETEVVELILKDIDFKDNLYDDEILEENFLKGKKFRKIKKKLIYDIAFARIYEISELLMFKNVNFKQCSEMTKMIFLEIDEGTKLKGLNKIFRKVFSKNDDFDINFQNNLPTEEILSTAHKLVHFGWKKEAIPISETKKTLIRRLFEAIFN